MTHQVNATRKWAGVGSLAILILAGVLLFVFMPQGARTLVDDTDNDGIPDLWVWADENGNMTRLEKDKNADGKVDWREFFGYDEGRRQEVRQRIEADMDYDGRFETTLRFDAKGQLQRLERDRNGDDKLDMILRYDDPAKPPSKTERDDDFDGEFEWQTERGKGENASAKPNQASPPSADAAKVSP